MKAILRSLALYATLGLATGATATMGCGPSTAEIAKAKQARYSIKPNSLLDIAVDVAKKHYWEVGVVADTGDGFTTKMKIFTQDGAVVNTGAMDVTGQETVVTNDGAIAISLVVRVDFDGATSGISVKSVARRYRASLAAFETFNDVDQSKPQWVDSKAEVLWHDIWSRAKQYEVAPSTTSTIAPTTPAAAPVTVPPTAEPAAAPAPDVPAY